MIARSAIWTCALAALVVSSAAYAQSSNGERVALRKKGAAFAACIVKKHHARAAEAILSGVGNRLLADDYFQLRDEKCAEMHLTDLGTLRLPGDFMRYIIADALVNAEFGDSGPATFSDRLPLSHAQMPVQADFDRALSKEDSPKKREELTKIYTSNIAFGQMSRFGECVVRADPVNSRLLLLTPPQADEEPSRFSALRTAISNCLSEGTTTLPKETLRGTVAMNYYRLARATPRPSQQKVD